MGKSLVQQARGRGGPSYRVPSFRYAGEAKYLPLPERTMTGKVVDIVHCQGHSAPLLSVVYENKETGLLIAPEGIRIGDTVMLGGQPAQGNALMLKDIPEGTLVCNLESNPGDGGKFARASGTFAKVLTKFSHQIVVMLPSKKQKTFLPSCRATIGTVAGGGRTEKPFMKAGIKYYHMKQRNKYWPKTSGTSQNAVDHPFGGKRSSRKGRATVAPKYAPPGRKVGKLHPRKTGRFKLKVTTANG